MRPKNYLSTAYSVQSKRRMEKLSGRFCRNKVSVIGGSMWILGALTLLLFGVVGCQFDPEVIPATPEPGGESPTEVCGDGVVAPTTEECDDGNVQDGDGCSSSCKVEEGDPGCVGRACELCGNGKADEGEACDDGNFTSNDGCSGTCQVETGWQCPRTGACTPICGDGFIRGGEACDDRNQTSHDGCSETCQLEEGYICTTPGMRCQAVERCTQIQRDGAQPVKIQGKLACLDENLDPGDGCDARCHVEPGYQCTTFAGCQKTCGNGILNEGEGCDDGNINDHDGCSSRCQREPGYKCYTYQDSNQNEIQMLLTQYRFALPGIPVRFCPNDMISDFQQPVANHLGIPKCNNHSRIFNTIYSRSATDIYKNPYVFIKTPDGLKYEHHGDILTFLADWRNTSSEFRYYLKYDPDKHDSLELWYGGKNDFFVYVNRVIAIKEPGLTSFKERALVFNSQRSYVAANPVYIDKVYKRATGKDLKKGDIIEISYFQIARGNESKVALHLPKEGVLGPSYCVRTH